MRQTKWAFISLNLSSYDLVFIQSKFKGQKVNITLKIFNGKKANRPPYGLLRNQRSLLSLGFGETYWRLGVLGLAKLTVF